MNQFTQACFVAAIRHCPLERAVDPAANRAAPQAVGVRFGISGKYALPTNRAQLAARWMDAGQAIRTHGQTGNVQLRVAADAAIGRKQYGEQTFRKPSAPISSPA